MTTAEMNRRLATMTPAQLRLAYDMVRQGYGSRGVAAESSVTVKQANAMAEWISRYGSILPPGTAARAA